MNSKKILEKIFNNHWVLTKVLVDYCNARELTIMFWIPEKYYVTSKYMVHGSM